MGFDRHLSNEKTDYCKNNTHFNVNVASVLHCRVTLCLPPNIKSLLLFHIYSCHSNIRHRSTGLC
jgi:hypothetical protein